MMTRQARCAFLLGVGALALPSAARADEVGLCPANTVVAGPVSGPALPPNCRALTSSDVPVVPVNPNIPVVPAGGTVASTIPVLFGRVTNPIDYGADPTGVIDSTFAIQAAIQSGTYVVFSPGTYILCSTRQSPYPGAFGPVGVLVQSKSNFAIDFGSAIIKICDGISGNASGIAYFQFDKNTNYRVTGGNFVGNMTGKNTGALTAGISSTNDVNFTYSGQIFTGDWQSHGGGGAAYDGDFLVNGVFDGAKMNNVSVCFDVAFLQNVAFTNFVATGKFLNGPGNTCFSELYDVPNAPINATGYTVTDSTNVTVQAISASGFNAGWQISSGSSYVVDGNWSGNVGSASTAGYGGIVGYNNGGAASSIGRPPKDLILRGHYDNEGNGVQGGGGIVITSGNITNSDIISNISVDATFINNTNVGIETTDTTHVADVRVAANCAGLVTVGGISGCLGPNINAVVNPTATVSAAAPVNLSSVVPAQITSLQLSPGVWYVNGIAGIVPAGGTTISALAAAIWTASAAFPGNAGGPGYILNGYPSDFTGFSQVVSLGTVRFNLATTTTIFLNIQANFSGGTNAGFGTLSATRSP